MGRQRRDGRGTFLTRRMEHPRERCGGTESVEVGDMSLLTSFSFDGEQAPTPSQSHEVSF
jgi:hypothetical protein